MRVALVNPPFANYRRPSIGLTQLRSSIRQELPEVRVDIHNLNLDCVTLLGTGWYDDISDGFQSWTGLGDWLFRPLAFPDAPHNADEYLEWLRRPETGWFTHNATEPHEDRSAAVLRFQRTLCEALPGFIDRRGLASYDVVGVTTMFAQTLCGLAVLRRVKELNPDVVTLMGGANCESPMGEAMVEKFDCVDRVFSGRATRSFPAFLRAYRDAGSLAATPAVPGVLQRDPPAPPPAVVQLAPRRPEPAASCGDPPAAAATALPSLALDYDDFVRELAEAPFESEMVLCFETSVGCWWGQKSHCTFCGLNSNSMEYRALDADEAVELIQGLVDRYGGVCKSFEAVDNILSHRYFADVLPRLRMPDDVSLFYEVKANLTEAHVRELAGARVTRIQPGMESISTEALKLLRKGVDAPRNVTLLRNCCASQVDVDWNLLVSIPGESASIYEHTFREAPKLVHLQPPAGAFEIRFDRYSPYYKDPAQFGVELAPFRFYSYLYPFGEPWLSRLAYFFESAGGPRGGAESRERVARVREMINAWRARWGGAARPVLEMDPAAPAPTVTDTRDPARPSRHVLDDAQSLALDFLRQPRSLAQLDRHLAERGVAPARAAETLAAIRERGWIFEEGTHCVSIIVDRRPPAHAPELLAEAAA